MTKYNAIAYCLILASHITHAQFVNAPYTMRTPGGNVMINNRIYMPSHYNGGTTKVKFNFVVTLNNDSVLDFNSKILSENKKMYLLYKHKKTTRKIFPSDTKQIKRWSASQGEMKGIAADSCWFFELGKGAINSYSTLPAYFTTNAIQKGDNGEIVTLNAKNLEAMTGTEDEKIMKLIKKDRYEEAITYYNKKHKGSK